MKYLPPYGASDPNASYANGNPSTGTMGSILDIRVEEYLQREIQYVITQAGLSPTNADLTQLWQALRKASAFTLNRVILVSSGIYTPSAGLLFADVELAGGGGGGGGSTGGSGTTSAGGGAGGGGYVRSFIPASSLTAPQAVTIGAAGPGGAPGSTGGAGGNSSFGSGLLTANGGAPGGGCTAYTIVNSGGAPGIGGGAGASVGVSISRSGGPGFPGNTFGPTSSGVGGRGGDTLLGFGGANGFQTDGAQAPPGNGFGAGGAGAGSGASSISGGNGIAGACIITEYIRIVS